MSAEIVWTMAAGMHCGYVRGDSHSNWLIVPKDSLWELRTWTTSTQEYVAVGIYSDAQSARSAAEATLEAHAG
jgi:hypothetical protein